MASKSGDTIGATAHYIETMLMELRTMSQGINTDMLTYLLEMAMVEASDVASGKISAGRTETKVITKAGKPDAEELAALFMGGSLK